MPWWWLFQVRESLGIFLNSLTAKFHPFAMRTRGTMLVVCVSVTIWVLILGRNRLYTPGFALNVLFGMLKISGTFQQAASIAKKKQSTLPKIATGLWKIRLLDWSLFQIIQQDGCPTSYVSLPESSVWCGELLGTKIAWYCCKNIGFKYFILISIFYIHIQIFIYIYIYLFISLLSFDFLAAEWNSFTLWH